MPASAGTVELVAPSLERLPSYVDALARGWSPDVGRDVSDEQLVAIAMSPEAFIAELTTQAEFFTLPSGRRVPSLPFCLFWIWDGAFAGTINLRYQPGSETLPPYISGHIGYSVVSWKRRRGYATKALQLILPVARQHGLKRVLVTCDLDNVASRKVIEANGGIYAGLARHPVTGTMTKRQFWIDLA